MNCPGCSRSIKETPSNCVSISETQEHLWGICPYCKEVMHFVHFLLKDDLYGWIESGEAAHAKKLECLQTKKHVLYVPSGIVNGDFLRVCRDFASTCGWDVGFAVSSAYEEKAHILNMVHTTVVMSALLFPVYPSFLAEKILQENVSGKIYSTEKTLSDRFEILK